MSLLSIDQFPTDGVIGDPSVDYILIEGTKSPGKATVRGANSPRGWDIRKGYALSGATVVPSGDELAEGIKVLFEFWEESQLTDWYAYAAKYFDKSVRFVLGSLTPRPLGIFHPVLAAPPIGITEVVVKDCTQLENDGYGLWSCELTLLQYRKPKPAPAAPSAAIPAALSAAPTALDAADREMQAKLAQFQSLTGGP
ncbi:MAG TPA: hypothetical protein VF765_31085 [Polyangiaceae bacterium]